MQNHRDVRLLLWFAGVLVIGCGAQPLAIVPPALPTGPWLTIPREPPPGRVELVPPRPHRDAVWIDGVWNWTDRRWVWTKGSWVIPPPGATYWPWSVVRAPDAKLQFAPATWRNAQGNVIGPPPALATATVTTVPVLNFDGTQARSITKQD